LAGWLPGPLLLVALTGCAGDQALLGPQAAAAPPTVAAAEDKPGWEWSKLNPARLFRSKAPAGAADTLVLTGGKLVPDHSADEKGDHAELAGAHDLYRQGDYAKAEKLFHQIAENTKNPGPIAEEARFYEADCLRRQEYYPRACDTYHKALLDFPQGQFREQCVQRMFDIGNYWLEDTRKEMQAKEEQRDGKRWLTLTPVVHFERAKPFLDQEGRALEALERARINDIDGPLADKALFLIASVTFYREDYRTAEIHFTQLVELYPNSKLAPQAVELGIISKHMSTGGSDYDGRKVAEARQLVNIALASYPTLAQDPAKREFLTRQIENCNAQQAEQDYKIAELYRRTGQPGSAYFYYEIVRRRYPGTKYADQATEKMHDLHAAAQKEQQQLNVPAVPAATPARPEVETAPRPRPVPAPDGLETAPAPRRVPGN